jgi:hypothetical protein
MKRDPKGTTKGNPKGMMKGQPQEKGELIIAPLVFVGLVFVGFSLSLMMIIDDSEYH